MSKVKVAVIGCGTIANSAHIPSYTNNPDAEIKYFCDIIPELSLIHISGPSSCFPPLRSGHRPRPCKSGRQPFENHRQFYTFCNISQHYTKVPDPCCQYTQNGPHTIPWKRRIPYGPPPQPPGNPLPASHQEKLAYPAQRPWCRFH